MTQSTIDVHHIARIEGHGNVQVSIKDGQLDSVLMNIVEPARLFENMVVGRSYEEISYISSRICGICSASHVVTDLKAIEKAFDIKVTNRTRALRELLIYGSYLQNHATHLFVFAAPDYVGEKSVFPLAETQPELFENALALKALGNELCTKVGGRSVHPITAVVGGFTQEIGVQEYLELAHKMRDMIPFALKTVDLFKSFEVPEIQTSGELLAMVEEDYYPVECSDRLCFARSGTEFDSSEYDDFIEEYQVDHSSAFFAREKETKRSYMTSALSRINVSWQHLGKEAKMSAAKAGLRPPEFNPFANNVAQAVELVDALDRCAGICENLATDVIEGTSTPVDFLPKAGRGIGFTEAPRGTLFHDITFDDEGKVLKASIMTPTAQNLANLEADIATLVKHLLDEGYAEGDIRIEVEKLVRAYDPCLSCSVH